VSRRAIPGPLGNVDDEEVLIIDVEMEGRAKIDKIGW